MAWHGLLDGLADLLLGLGHHGLEASPHGVLGVTVFAHRGVPRKAKQGEANTKGPTNFECSYNIFSIYIYISYTNLLSDLNLRNAKKETSDVVTNSNINLFVLQSQASSAHALELSPRLCLSCATRSMLRPQLRPSPHGLSKSTAANLVQLPQAPQAQAQLELCSECSEHSQCR